MWLATSVHRCLAAFTRCRMVARVWEDRKWRVDTATERSVGRRRFGGDGDLSLGWESAPGVESTVAVGEPRCEPLLGVPCTLPRGVASSCCCCTGLNRAGDVADGSLLEPLSDQPYGDATRLPFLLGLCTCSHTHTATHTATHTSQQHAKEERTGGCRSLPAGCTVLGRRVESPFVLGQCSFQLRSSLGRAGFV